MKISEIGEFALIDRIASLLPSAPADVVVGIGDDVAVLRSTGEKYLLATCDVQVENVHFLAEKITPRQLGGKIAAINLSDIAAMGGTPEWALVSLVLPEHKRVSFVDDLYRGMQEQMTAAGAVIVGGNISRAHVDVIIDFFLMGQVDPRNLICRNGAQEGDAVMVTGFLGDSRAGLELLSNPDRQLPPEIRDQLVARHLMPQPRLREGQALGRCGRVHAMADVSDGLIGDLRHICRASGLGAEIRVAEMPVSPACVQAAAAAGIDPLGWALTGGEDYELLFTAAPEVAENIAAMLLRETGTVCRVIGRMTAAAGGIRVLTADGGKWGKADHLQGWDHFAVK